MLIVAGNVGDGVALDGDDLMLPERREARMWLDDEANRAQTHRDIDRDLMLLASALYGEEDMLGILVGDLVADLTV